MNSWVTEHMTNRSASDRDWPRTPTWVASNDSPRNSWSCSCDKPATKRLHESAKTAAVAVAAAACTAMRRLCVASNSRLILSSSRVFIMLGGLGAATRRVDDCGTAISPGSDDARAGRLRDCCFSSSKSRERFLDLHRGLHRRPAPYAR